MSAPDALPLLVAGPLLLAALLTAAGRWLPRAVVDAVAVAGAATVLGVSCWLCLRAADGAVVSWQGGWSPHDGVTIGVGLVADPAAAGLVALVAALATAALVFSIRYFEEVEGLFHALVLLFVAGMVGFALAGDLFTMFVFFELMSVAAFALTGYKIEELSSLHGALTFAVVNSIGAYTTLLGIGLVYARTGALNLAQAGQELSGRPADALVVAAFALVCTGWLVKAAVVPFHFWMADAHAVAPSPVCVLFSGAMVELGLYGVLRVGVVVFDAPLGEPPLKALLLVTGGAACVVGAVMCTRQEHLKRMLAFSTVAHTGFVACALAGVDTDAVGGAALYVVAHAAVKGALFLTAGALRSRFDTVSEPDLFGVGRSERTLAVVWLVAAVGLAAVPPAGLWFGKDYIDEAHVHAGTWEVVVLGVLVSALTGGAALRVWIRVFLGRGTPTASQSGSEPAASDAEEETTEQLTRTPWVMKGSALALVVVGWGAGAVPVVRRAFLAAGEQLLHGDEYRAAVLHGSTSPLPNVPLPPSLTALGLASGLTAAAGMVVVALLGARGTGLPRLVAPLARLHSGRLGDDVAWLFLGIALLGGMVALTAS